MKKKSPQEEIVEMKCAVCNSCYRLKDSPFPTRCYFGGPYYGYRVTQDGL